MGGEGGAGGCCCWRVQRTLKASLLHTGCADGGRHAVVSRQSVDRNPISIYFVPVFKGSLMVIWRFHSRSISSNCFGSHGQPRGELSKNFEKHAVIPPAAFPPVFDGTLELTTGPELLPLWYLLWEREVCSSVILYINIFNHSSGIARARYQQTR